MHFVSGNTLKTAAMVGFDGAGDGIIDLASEDGTLKMRLEATEGNGATAGAQITLWNGASQPTISIDADVNGKGRIITEELQITGGADLVESFHTDRHCDPGTVVVIDSEHAGALTVAEMPYDRRVAGVVSGAGGLVAGLSMGQEGVASGDTSVAMTGRVYVKSSAENGAIRPGDLLTTAALDGHAMKATDPARAFGATIGKAMSPLDEGTGLVLVLVNLQ